MAQIKGKATVNEIYDVLEQQKKLDEVKRVIINTLEKVNQSIMSITVENLQLTRSNLDEEKNEEKPPIIKQEKNTSSSINQQLLDIEVRHPCLNEEIESDEDLDRL